MNSTPNSTVPTWYWVIATLALLWNLIGCGFFAMELLAQEALLESWTDAQKEWARSIPTWIYFVYGIAVLTGVLGSVGLLLRKRWAIPVFAASLAAVLIQMSYTMIVLGGIQVTDVIMPSVVISLAAILAWFARWANSKSWLAG